MASPELATVSFRDRAAIAGIGETEYVRGSPRDLDGLVRPAFVVEATRQLRRAAGDAQVKNAEIGVISGWGDFRDATILLILRRGT